MQSLYEIQQASTRGMLSIVIPTYNECQNIVAVVKRVKATLDKAWKHPFEMIVVDDNSPDQTWKIAEQLKCEVSELTVIRREGERGLATAVICGWLQAKGDILGVIDADLQHPPEVLEVLLKELKDENLDLIVASRHVKGGGVSDWNVFRRMISRSAQLIAWLMLSRTVNQVTDPLSGFFLVRRNAIADCQLSPIGYKILLEVLRRGRIHSIKEVGYVFQERRKGGSKAYFGVYLEFIAHLFRMRFSGKGKGQ